VYFQNYIEPRAELFTGISSVCFLFPNRISDPETSPKIFCSENSKMTSF
jgi:hypothetical protein